MSINTMSAASVGSTRPTGKGLHIGLWTTQVVLAALFVMSGVTKLTAPVDQLQAQMPWVSGALGGAVRIIGVAELLGALGLLLPAATRIMPVLTTVAGIGLSALMLGASVTHLARGEFAMIAFTLPVAGLAAFVAWGRFSASPIASRG